MANLVGALASPNPAGQVSATLLSQPLPGKGGRGEGRHWPALAIRIPADDMACPAMLKGATASPNIFYTPPPANLYTHPPAGSR